MKRILSYVLAVFSALSLPVAIYAQTPTNPSSNTFNAGVYYSPNYNYGGPGPNAPAPLRVFGGTTATGVGTVTVQFGSFTTHDGKNVFPFTNVTQNGLSLPPITIDSGANLETVTPSSVSCQTPTIIQSCTITATFTYVHGNGVLVRSGDAGLQEAINDSALNNGGMVYWVIDPGEVTLSTTSQTTNASTVNIPTRSTVIAATAKVTTTITGCSGGWSLGYSSGTEFGAANTTLTAGTNTDSSTLVYNYAFNAAAHVPIIFCTTGDATAGVIHPKYFGYKMVAPAY